MYDHYTYEDGNRLFMSNIYAKLTNLLVISACLISLSSCGFHLQGMRVFPAAFQQVYLQINDPYGSLAKNITAYFRSSHVTLVQSPKNARLILNILKCYPEETLLSTNGAQQTAQYRLTLTLIFALYHRAHLLAGPETLQETQVITIQTNQILGHNNEVMLRYQQMYQAITERLIDRLTSKEIANLIAANQTLDASHDTRHNIQ